MIEQQTVWNVLRQVIDPEIGCNLVDLGLIYDVAIHGNTVDVTMTLTTPGCPMHESLADGVRLAVMQLEAVQEVNVKVVWDPPWDQSMITEDGRVALGFS